MKKIFNILVFFMMTVTTFSEIKINIDNSNPFVKQNIIFTVEFLNEEKSEYEIENINKFKIISKNSRSNYNVLDNKKIKYSKSDVYILSPYTTGEISLVVKSKKGTESNTIILNVSKEKNKKIEDKRLLLETTNYTRDYYYGEKIPFVEKIIIKKSIGNYSYISTPTFNEFSIKNVTPRDSRGFVIPKRITINGKEQIELLLFRSILEPNSTGKKIIKTGGVSVSELTEDDKVKSPVYLGFKELKINILPLPENKFKNFQGIIGRLNGDYKWFEKTENNNKKFILKLRLYGNVNLDKLQKVVYFDGNKFEVKENLVMTEEHVLDHIYSAERKYIITFIPKNNEIKEPPTIKIPYFDSIKKKYREFVISPTLINVISDDNLYELNFQDEILEKHEENTILSKQIESKNEMLSLENIEIENKKGCKSTKNFAIIITLVIIILIEGICILKLKRDKKKIKKGGKDGFYK